MGERAFDFEKESVYHIYNRGYNKQRLFFDEYDYERFLKNLKKYTEKYPLIEIKAFCILPNHFHFLLCERSNSSRDFYFESAQEISHFMRDLQLSYAAFFNCKYKEKIKKGLKVPVFEGRFQARVVLDDSYFTHLKNYVEYNPVKHEYVSEPQEWPYSSFDKSSDSFWPDEFDPFFV